MVLSATFAVYTRFADAGVTMMFAATGLAPVFSGVNEPMSPVPFAANPIPGVSLTQLKVFPMPIKLIGVEAMPFVKVCGETGFIVGNAFTVPVTVTVTG